MLNNQFVKLPTERTTRGNSEEIINHHFINFAVPSNSGQVGESIVILARGPERTLTVATTYDLDTLARKISHLKPVQMYSTGMGRGIGPGLVNMSRVVRITEYEQFVCLYFVDGEEIAVTNRLFDA